MAGRAVSSLGTLLGTEEGELSESAVFGSNSRGVAQA